MLLNTLRFVSMMATAVAMAAGFAHLLELPGKIGLPRDEYLIIQQIYRGWALLGIVILVELRCALLRGAQSADAGAPEPAHLIP